MKAVSTPRASTKASTGATNTEAPSSTLGYDRVMRDVKDRIATVQARQASWLALAIWGSNIFLLLAPYPVSGQAVPAAVAASVCFLALTGAILSMSICWLAARLGSAPANIRYGAVALGCIAGGALAAAIDATLGADLRRAFDPDLSAVGSQTVIFRFVTNWFGLAWIIGLNGALFLMIEANRLARDHQRGLAEARAVAGEARAAATAARLAALRYQLNPHFLFNALNAVSSAVITGRSSEAEAMLSRLAEFLRVTLSSDPEGLIPLEDELATLQNYLEIETERFRDRLGVDFACPSELRGALIPSFILQPLVENAIKHAVAHTSRTVTIRMEAARDGDDLVILVEDDGDGKAAGTPGTGVGLHNIRQRLEALYGARGALQTTPREQGFLALVRLPLQWAQETGRRAA